MTILYLPVLLICYQPKKSSSITWNIFLTTHVLSSRSEDDFCFAPEISHGGAYTFTSSYGWKCLIPKQNILIKLWQLACFCNNGRHGRETQNRQWVWIVIFYIICCLYISGHAGYLCVVNIRTGRISQLMTATRGHLGRGTSGGGGTRVTRVTRVSRPWHPHRGSELTHCCGWLVSLPHSSLRILENERLKYNLPICHLFPCSI